MLLGLASSGPALGNGRPPAVLSLTAEPGTPRLYAGTTYGVLASRDAGASWQLLCEVPIGISGADVDPIVATPPGILLIGTHNGAWYSRNFGCDFSKVAGAIDEKPITAIAVSGRNPMRVLATTRQIGQPNGVYVSNDGGTTFASPPVTEPMIFLGVTFASPTSDRVYALAYDSLTAPVAWVLRSDDAGASYPVRSSVSNLVSPALVGADPQHPERVYLHGLRSGASVLYRSIDGAASFTEVPVSFGRIFGATFAPDGTLYLATRSGVRRSSDGLAFSTPPADATQVSCLAWISGTLYGCGNDFQNGFTIGRSTDGEHFTPVLRVEDITGPLACAPGTQTCTTCYPLWETFASQNLVKNAQAPACVGAPAPDGGGPAPASPSSSCAMAARGELGLGLLGASIALATAGGRGRSRRRRRRAGSKAR